MEIKAARYTQNDLVKIKPSGYNGYPNGSDNYFSDYLDGLYNASVTHQGIINDLTSYIIGKGLVAENPKDQAILDRFFPKKKTSKIVLIDLIQNTKSLEIIKDSLYNITEINVLLPKQIRVKTLKAGEPCDFLYKQSWKLGDYGYRNTADFEIYKTGIENQKSLFYEYDSGTFDVPYGRPYYMSGLNAIEMEAGIYLMHNHGVQNGMFPSMIIDRETSGSIEGDDTSTEDIVRSAAGAAAAGKIIDIKRPPGSNPLTITTPALSGIDKIFNQQYVTAETGISKAHGLPSSTLIAGLNIKPTGFGDAEEEMQWSLNQWKQKKINPYRSDFLDDLKPLFEDLGITSAVTFSDEVDQNQEMSYSYDSETLKAPNTNSVITNITGRQMQAIERLVRKYRKEDINYNQAALMLKNGYGFNDDEVKVWLNDIEKFKDFKNDDIQALIDLGEDFPEGFVEVSRVDYNKDLEEEFDKQLLEINKDIQNFVSTGPARPNAASEDDGTKGDVAFKVRYQYAGDSTGEREFCRRMLAANRIYRKEDIERMSTANPSFAPKGSSSYSIFEWKGGIYCHHKWERVTYVKKGISERWEIRNIEANKLTESQADQRGMKPDIPRLVEIRPIDTPSRGRLTFREQIKKWL